MRNFYAVLRAIHADYVMFYIKFTPSCIFYVKIFIKFTCYCIAFHHQPNPQLTSHSARMANLRRPDYSISVMCDRLRWQLRNMWFCDICKIFITCVTPRQLFNFIKYFWDLEFFGKWNTIYHTLIRHNISHKFQLSP